MLVDVLLVVGNQGLGDGLADGVNLGGVATTADSDADVCSSLVKCPASCVFISQILNVQGPPSSPPPAFHSLRLSSLRVMCKVKLGGVPIAENLSRPTTSNGS